MKKIKTLLKAPLLVQSGYSVHSRQIFKALFSDEIFDLYCENINWGNCSFLTEDTEEKRKIRKCIEKRIIEKHQGNNQFDLFIHVTIPNEFERQGKFNIGVTAGIETDRVSHVWVQKCNEMDLIIVPSEHSRKTLCNTTIDWEDPRTGNRGSFKVVKPVEVVHEGFNPVFKKWIETPDFANRLYQKLQIDTPFNFLHVGQWGKGGYGEDRKNIALLVKYFIETFRGRQDVGLVLKINMARNSIMDYSAIQNRLREIKSNFKESEVPPIYLLHSNLSDDEMVALYNHPKIKAMITLSHGEGFCVFDYTKIITEQGLKRIDEIKVGEKVLTHKGRFMPVTKELSREYDGDMYEILTYDGANKEKVTLTGNHRIYVFRENGSFDWIAAENLKRSDILCIPKPKYRQFENIKTIKISDFVQNENICLIENDTLIYKHSAKKCNPVKNTININNNFAKIIGYYLAGGSCANSTIHFSLHKKEKDTIAKELILAFKDVFGLESFNVLEYDNKVDLTFNSKIVELFLKSFCGEDSKTKFIHSDIFKFTREVKMNLVTSLILGDGYIKEKNNNSSIEISLVNENILRSVRILLLEEGIVSNFDFFNRKGLIKEKWSYDSNVERLRVAQTEFLNQLIGWINKNHNFADISRHETTHVKSGRPKSWTTKDYCLFEVKDINKIYHEGEVYNLSVDEDESYCTENFVVHNCLPLLEASACALPVLATDWSGHLDFLNLGKFLPLEYELKEIPDVAVWQDILVKGSRWACVKESNVKERMRKIVASYSKPEEWAAELATKIHEKFNLDTVCDKFIATVKSHMIKKDVTAKVDPREHLQSFVDTPENFNVIYTMPMSTGDVFISTAVIDGLVKELPEDFKIYFATQQKYADVLRGNPHIYKVIPWNETMVNIDLLESVFDLALTPNITTQYNFSNWVRRGQGRLLAEEFANHCGTQLGEYFIGKDTSLLDSAVETKKGTFTFLKNELYMTFHPGSGQGQWEARRYEDWQEVLNNLKGLYPDLLVVQVGSTDEPAFEGIDVDLRGKTSHQQLASVVENSKLHLSIDTFSMHLAAALNVPLVALFGCSYATATGPWVKNKETAKYILLQSDRLSGCKDKACYKNRCAVNPEGNGPINEIDPREVFQACVKILKDYE